jgi:DNA-binding response OmpR family regulator
MPKRILVIDDLGIMLDLVEYMLQMAGYEVMTAGDAFTALAQIETTTPHLILLDVMMPRMSGYEFIEQLRQRHHALPIILLTVKEHTPEDIDQLGVAGYLRKPFHQSELLSLLHKLLSDPQNSHVLF